MFHIFIFERTHRLRGCLLFFQTDAVRLGQIHNVLYRIVGTNEAALSPRSRIDKVADIHTRNPRSRRRSVFERVVFSFVFKAHLVNFVSRKVCSMICFDVNRKKNQRFFGNFLYIVWYDCVAGPSSAYENIARFDIYVLNLVFDHSSARLFFNYFMIIKMNFYGPFRNE